MFCACSLRKVRRSEAVLARGECSSVLRCAVQFSLALLTKVTVDIVFYEVFGLLRAFLKSSSVYYSWHEATSASFLKLCPSSRCFLGAAAMRNMILKLICFILL